MQSLEQIYEMTLTEYHYRMIALRYKQLYMIQERYDLAFAIRDVEATEKKGKKEVYVYKNTNDIIDYKQNLERIKKGQSIIYKNSKNVEPSSNNVNKLLRMMKEHNNKQ